MNITSPSGPAVSEFAQRRARVLKALDGAAACVFSGEGPPPLFGKWRAVPNFVYLTGLTDEPGGAVLFDPTAEDPKRRIVLFLRPMDPELERWDGYREPISSALKQRTGFETVMRMTNLPRSLTAAARRAKRLACLHPLAVYPAAVSPDLSTFRQVTERIPGVSIEDRTQLLAEMRASKSKGELALMKKAVECTTAGYEAAMKMIRPGINEADVALALEHGYLQAGGDGVAYNSIVGSGLNGTVLHYNANNGPLDDGDLMVIDSAAAYKGYASDVTRTFPVSGKFTAEQRKIYDIVLAAQEASIKATRAGATFTDIDIAGRSVIEKAGYGDYFIHGMGHHLGLEVHDITPDQPLKPGAVITIEPGIYIPEKKMGIRIEDDILVLARGNQNLTAHIPKTIAAIEKAMAR